MIPLVIRIRPRTFPSVIGSWKNNALKKSTAMKAMLMNGYANETWNFVTAAIQKRLATNAAANPDRMNGSKNAFARN